MEKKLKIRIKSCLGCYALENGQHYDYCVLGYKTEKISGVAGFYGKSKQLIACNIKPIEICPKPRTSRKYVEAFEKRQKYFRVQK